jgi:CheY-like chemotaxis protein
MKDHGGELVLELDRVAVGADNPAVAPGIYCRLTVADTGPGIDAAIVDRVFEPFFTTKQPGEGTGLGLSVVHGIVKDHGGYVEIHSDGQGAAFHVHLPLNEDAGLAVHEAGPVEPPPGAEKILVVDDDADMMRTITRILAQLGYRAVGKTSSNEALQLFKTSPRDFDLVLTDQVMPELAGDALAREIHAARPEVPIIVYSAGGEHWSPSKMENLGVARCIVKPISLTELARSIREVLDDAPQAKPPGSIKEPGG